MGWTLLFPKTFQGMLGRIRGNRVKAVVLNGNHEEADALEAALNIRDIDSRMPILFLQDKRRKQPDSFLSSLPRIITAGRLPRISLLRGRIRRH